MMVAVTSSFYSPDPLGGYVSHPTTASPWGPTSQHFSPPAALTTRALEQLPDAQGRVLGRVTFELLGPVPVGRLEVSARVVRPGRTVALAEATLVDADRDRPVCRASAWLFPDIEQGAAAAGPPLPHGPADGELHERPRGWSGGYLDAVDWRWVAGAVLTPGPATVWARPLVPLLPDEAWTPTTLVMAVVDSASGVSAMLDPAVWSFMNTELTVHLLRPPVGDWLCLDARTTIASGSVGMATSEVYDEVGLVARSAQALLVTRR